MWFPLPSLPKSGAISIDLYSMILLDTHVVVWLASGDARMSRSAQGTIDEARQSGSTLAISDITLMEIAQLSHRRRIEFPGGLESFLSEVERRFTVLPINGNIALQAFELPARYPNDPADRIIGATALIEDIPLLTADAAIRNSRAVPTIW
jgi:PIN domain nuclease of toxin-antitoxin system